MPVPYPRQRATAALRKGIGRYCSKMGVPVTYRRWNATAKAFDSIENVYMIRTGRTIREDVGDIGVLEAQEESYIVNEDALTISGSMIQPSTTDQIVDNGAVMEVVDFNRDALEGIWTFRTRRLPVTKAAAGQQPLYRGAS